LAKQTLVRNNCAHKLTQYMVIYEETEGRTEYESLTPIEWRCAVFRWSLRDTHSSVRDFIKIRSINPRLFISVQFRERL